MPAFSVHRDAETAAFFDGTARGNFLIVRDSKTGLALTPQFDVSVDPTRYHFEPASGLGTVVSWSVVHQRTAEGISRTVVGIVELAEGPWWWTEIADADPDADLLGARVRVDFDRAGFENDSSAEAIPYFRMAD